MFDLMPWRKREGKDLVGFKNELDNLFNRFFDLDFPISREFFKEGEWVLRVDVSEGKYKRSRLRLKSQVAMQKTLTSVLRDKSLLSKGRKNRKRKKKRKISTVLNDPMVPLPEE